MNFRSSSEMTQLLSGLSKMWEAGRVGSVQYLIQRHYRFLQQRLGSASVLIMPLLMCSSPTRVTPSPLAINVHELSCKSQNNWGVDTERIWQTCEVWHLLFPSLLTFNTRLKSELFIWFSPQCYQSSNVENLFLFSSEVCHWTNCNSFSGNKL